MREISTFTGERIFLEINVFIIVQKNHSNKAFVQKSLII